MNFFIVVADSGMHISLKYFILIHMIGVELGECISWGNFSNWIIYYIYNVFKDIKCRLPVNS